MSEKQWEEPPPEHRAGQQPQPDPYICPRPLCLNISPRTTQQSLSFTYVVLCAHVYVHRGVCACAYECVHLYMCVSFIKCEPCQGRDFTRSSWLGQSLEQCVTHVLNSSAILRKTPKRYLPRMSAWDVTGQVPPAPGSTICAFWPFLSAHWSIALPLFLCPHSVLGGSEKTPPAWCNLHFWNTLQPPPFTSA